MRFDLVLSGARVIDPSQGIDEVMDVAFSKAKVAATGQGLATDACRVLDVTGKIVTPGLIDLHTHVYWRGTSLGVDPLILARGGCTTLVDTGSAGPGNYAGFLEHVIRPSPVRIAAFLNVSFAGIFGFSKRVMVGESGDIRLLAPVDTVEVAEANRDTLAGIKVRVGLIASGSSGLLPLQVARQVADRVQMPLMVHIDYPPPTLPEVLELLRAGDILTHCFRPFPNTPATADGMVHPAVIAARERGVIFDIGHGMGSLSFETARVMLGNGFLPDCISSDTHAMCINGPVFDLVTTLSKFLCLGMPLVQVVKSATENPAKALRRSDIGTLKPGAAGDATVLELKAGSYQYFDSTGACLPGKTRLTTSGVVLSGKLWHQN